MITDDEIAELDKQFHNHCVDADSALTSIPLLIARLRAAEDENLKLKKEVRAKRTLENLLAFRAEEIKEADEWLGRIMAFKKEYFYPSSNNLSYEESQRIVMRFFEECESRAKEIGATKASK